MKIRPESLQLRAASVLGGRHRVVPRSLEPGRRETLRAGDDSRRRLDRQRRPDCPPVTEVPLNVDCRNEAIPILLALQHIDSRPEVRDPILRAVARDVNGRSGARRGRPGLSYREILVPACPAATDCP